MTRFLCIAISVFLLGSLSTQANLSQDVATQREAFREAWPKALDGDASGIRKNQTLLATYPLYPDLQAAWLRSQVGKVADSEVATFVAQHNASSAVRDLRYRWAKSLARRGQWQQYLEVYADAYAGSDDAVLACYALNARLRTAADARLVADALAFWLSGKSRPEECDPVFAWLEENLHIDDALRRQRIALALGQREFSLAAWLARPLSESDRDHVQRWRHMRQRPADMLSSRYRYADTADDRELVLYGIERLARRDFQAADTAWQRITPQLNFDAAEDRRVQRRLALAAAQDHAPEALPRILALDRRAIDDSLLEWGVRSALRDRDWRAALQVIGAMSQKTAQSEQWRYWRARALEATGDAAAAAGLYQQLADGRGFYNFMAADRLDLPYAYNHVPAVADDVVIGQLEQQAGLIRAREMFFVDLLGRARSEWKLHTEQLSRSDRAQSAILASRWGWHSAAISTASRSGLRDDLQLIYPVAFREAFELHTSQLDLPIPWAFGIARSESLFMPDVTSSAGALGLMQLMPETGRLTARQARIRYRGRYTLLDPSQNIALGTFYLDKMYSRFGDHQVLATAAYNAGPHRVARWLPDDEAIASDIWVETVPYRETRGYLRRVLAADAIFHWRLTGETRRLATIMPPVPRSTH